MGGISDNMRSGVRISTVPSTHINIHPSQLDSPIMVMLPILLCSVLALSMALPTTDKDSAEVAYERVTVTPSQEPDLSMVRQKRALGEEPKVVVDKAVVDTKSRADILEENGGATFVGAEADTKASLTKVSTANLGGQYGESKYGDVSVEKYSGWPPQGPAGYPVDFYNGCPAYSNYYRGYGPSCPQPSVCNNIHVRYQPSCGDNKFERQ